MVENRENNGSRNNKEHQVEKWDMYLDVQLVVHRDMCQIKAGIVSMPSFSTVH
jgi:hypothetical protein